MPVDPNALVTWANAITAGRLVLSPVMFLVIPDHQRGAWLAYLLWFALSLSDGIDGWVARRHGTTSTGAFLDPLADKVLVLGAMFTLVSRDMFPLLPVLLIAGRELVISVYRVLVGSKGVSVPASKIAKYKTVVQQLAGRTQCEQKYHQILRAALHVCVCVRITCLRVVILASD